MDVHKMSEGRKTDSLWISSISLKDVLWISIGYPCAVWGCPIDDFQKIVYRQVRLDLKTPYREIFTVEFGQHQFLHFSGNTRHRAKMLFRDADTRNSLSSNLEKLTRTEYYFFGRGTGPITCCRMLYAVNNNSERSLRYSDRLHSNGDGLLLSTRSARVSYTSSTVLPIGDRVDQ